MKLYIYISNPEEFLQGDYDFCFRATSMTPEKIARSVPEYIHAGTVEVEINVEDRAVRQVAKSIIDAEMRKVRGESEAKLEALEHRKQRLLAIEHKGDNNE